MNSFVLYAECLIPKYHEMNASLNLRIIEQGGMKRNTLDMASYLNNMVDFLAHEKKIYLKENWNSANAKNFREALEKKSLIVDGQSYFGTAFGFVRDLANLSKHKKIGRPHALISDIADVMDCIMLIGYEDEVGFYYGTLTSVVAKTKAGEYIPCGIQISIIFQYFTNILIDSEIMKMPTIKLPSIRNFYQSRYQTERSNQVKINIQEKIEGKLIHRSFIYEDTNPLKLRSVKAGEEFNCKKSFELEVTKGIF